MTTKKKLPVSASAERLRAYLASLGITHYEASRRLGFSRPDYVYRLVTGRAPMSDSVMWKIFRTFGADAAYYISCGESEGE